MAFDFISHFDRKDTPEHTAGREGYFWFKDLSANDSEARLKVMIRDFDRGAFEERKKRIGEVATLVAAQYPTGSVRSSVFDTYDNIGDHLAADRRAANLLFSALDELGIERKIVPMRGGTDGAALSARGIPTPNFSRALITSIRASNSSLSLHFEILRDSAHHLQAGRAGDFGLQREPGNLQERIELMPYSAQAPAAVVMIRPHNFTVNNQTAGDNSFQTTGNDQADIAERLMPKSPMLQNPPPSRRGRAHV